MSAPLRAIWRVRFALDSLGSVLSSAPEVRRLHRQVLSRVPSKVFPVAAAVAVMVVVATYGVPRRTEVATARGRGAPEASPVRPGSSEAVSPLRAAEPAARTETPAVTLPTTTAPKDTPSGPRGRSRPGSLAKMRGTAPAPSSQAGASAIWVLGNSKDEQNVTPETETVRRERD